MGTSYYLVDIITSEKFHYDNYFKEDDLCLNSVVHMALINYMLDHPNHSFRFANDINDAISLYKTVDLKNYKLDNSIEYEMKKRIKQLKKQERIIFIKGWIRYRMFKLKYWLNPFNKKG